MPIQPLHQPLSLNQQTKSQANQNPWDDGFLVNGKRFFYHQVQAFLFLSMTVGWVFVWGLKQLQSLLKRS